MMENKTFSWKELFQEKDKNSPCVSIFVPTHRLSPERRGDQKQTEDAIKRAKEDLRVKYSNEDIRPIETSLDELYHSIDFNHNSEGLGLFVSKKIKQLTHFFFPVIEKVIVADSFEIRDLIYQDYYAAPYYVLHISEKGAVLLKGTLNALTELHDRIFPKKYEEQFEYSRPTRGSSYVGDALLKGFEKDKSIMEEIRLKEFLREVDKALSPYFHSNSVPLVLAGAKKDLSYYHEITRYAKNIIGQVHGNYSYEPISQLANLTWDVVQSYLNKANEGVIREFEEKIGPGYGITGIQDIWKASKEGRGLQLLIEKDFSIPGFLTKDDEYHLHLKSPKNVDRVIPDVTNDLIETILAKNGTVLVTENDSLKHHQRVALITRY